MAFDGLVFLSFCFFPHAEGVSSREGGCGLRPLSEWFETNVRWATSFADLGEEWAWLLSLLYVAVLVCCFGQPFWGVGYDYQVGRHDSSFGHFFLSFSS